MSRICACNTALGPTVAGDATGPTSIGMPKGNFVSEWFGHRVFPSVASTPSSLEDQRLRRCPFLSQAVGGERLCIKSAASLGICTIATVASGSKREWLACPYRALDQDMVTDAARRLFRVSSDQLVTVVPAPTLADAGVRENFLSDLNEGRVGVLFLQDKLGGEISITATPRSPELSFDITMVEVALTNGVPRFGKYGIVEVQTMDFHGSYRAVVGNLQDALRLHGERFHEAVAENPQWLSEKSEGPNVANVFKRTFYQIMLKFQIGADKDCAGCILALPTAVWDSWQKHLGMPDLHQEGERLFTLWSPERQNEAPALGMDLLV
jgi:Restriction endonuclease NotI